MTRQEVTIRYSGREDCLDERTGEAVTAVYLAQAHGKIYASSELVKGLERPELYNGKLVARGADEIIKYLDGIKCPENDDSMSRAAENQEDEWLKSAKAAGVDVRRYVGKRERRKDRILRRAGID